MELVAGAREGDCFFFLCASTICDLYPATGLSLLMSIFFTLQLQATQCRSQLTAKRRKMGKMNVIIFSGSAFKFQMTSTLLIMTDIVTCDDDKIQDNVRFLFFPRSSSFNTVPPLESPKDARRSVAGRC